MKKFKPIIIIEGEPKSVFLEILFKTLNTSKFKSPILLICSKKRFFSYMKKFKYKFKVNEIKNFDNETLSKLKKVETITLDEIHKKYNMNFNTLVIDCEGAFYYIIQSFPNILNNINPVLLTRGAKIRTNLF